MIVRLTTTQWHHVLGVVGSSGDEDLVEAYGRDVRPAGARVDVIAPYAGWVYVRELLADRAFNDAGYRRRGVPTSLQGALKRVAQAIGTIDRHPSLRQQAAFGHHGFWLPVWEIERTERGQIYHPYPHPGAPFSILQPAWEKTAGQPITYWTSEGGGDAPVLSELRLEQTHLRLWRQGVAQLVIARSPDLDG